MKKSTSEKFRTILNKIITSQYNETVGKQQISRIIKQWEGEETHLRIKEEIQLAICEDKLPDWIIKRFRYAPGYYYQDGTTVYGWYEETQIQAKELPLKLFDQKSDNDRRCEVFNWSGWENKGFVAAWSIPVRKRSDATGLEVIVPTDKWELFAKHGYASPCKLQWERISDYAYPGYYVTRTIISHGFWCAWQWHINSSKNWYYEKRPELFEDDEIWGQTELVWSTPPRPYDAVLGGKNRKVGKDLKFYYED